MEGNNIKEVLSATNKCSECGADIRQSHIKKILFATDFSPCSEYVFSSYAKLLQDTLGAKIYISHIISNLMDDLYEQPRDVGLDEMLPHAEKVIRKKIDEMCTNQGITDYEVIIKMGFPPEKIVKIAHDEKMDLILMGTLGRTGLDHLLAGSVAERVVRLAPCAVMTLKCPGRYQPHYEKL